MDECNSDWHYACFAAVAALSQEMNRRGFSDQKLH